MGRGKQLRMEACVNRWTMKVFILIALELSRIKRVEVEIEITTSLRFYLYFGVCLFFLEHSRECKAFSGEI